MATSGISVMYNGVVIENVNLRSVRTEPQYDTGDMSVMFNKTTISLDGTLSATDDGAGMVDLMNTARFGLSSPRGPLLITVGDTVLYDLTGPDHRDGPKPREVDVHEMVGSRFAIVTFTIDVYFNECSGTLGDVISHSFSVTHSIDETFATERTIRGRLVVRSDAALNNPDLFRGLVTPQVPTGFKRQRMTFVVADSGLDLDYEILDKEQYITTPLTMVRAEGSYTHRLTGMAQWVNIFEIEVEGPKNVPKIDTFNMAFNILSSRMDFTTELITDATITEKLYDNVIRLQVVTRVVLINSSGTAYPTTSKMLTPLAGSTTNTTTDIGPYGSALIAAAKKVFFLACTQNITAGTSGVIDASISNDTGIQVVVASSPVSADPTGAPSDKQNTTQLANPYVLYEESATWQQDNGVVLIPTTKPMEGSKIYQMHDPFAIILQKGRAIRQGKNVGIPPPLLNAHPGSTVIKYTPIEHAPYLGPDKRTLIYSCSWEYLIAVPIINSAAAGTNLITTTSGLVDIITTAPAMALDVPGNQMIIATFGAPTSYNSNSYFISN